MYIDKTKNHFFHFAKLIFSIQQFTNLASYLWFIFFQKMKNVKNTIFYVFSLFFTFFDKKQNMYTFVCIRVLYLFGHKNVDVYIYIFMYTMYTST